MYTAGMKRVLGLTLLLAVAAGLAYVALMTQRERSYRELVQRGDAALDRHDSFGAVEAFTHAIWLKDDSMAAHLKRGEAYRRRNEYEAALRDLRRAADLDPNAPLPRELLGDVHYGMALHDREQGAARFKRAADRYRESVALDDGAARVHYKLGLASYRGGHVPSAVDALRKAIGLDGGLAEAHYMLGVCLRAANRPEEAVRSLQRAISLARAFIPAREELADIYGRLGRNEERLAELEALLALQPGAARERALALAYASAGLLDRAVIQLGQAARKYPDDPETYVALGRLWLGHAGGGGRVEANKAIEALQGAVSTDSSSHALTLLGRAQLLAGDHARAEKTLQQASQRFPVDPAAFKFLADAAERRGHSELAARALLDYAALTRTESIDLPVLIRIAEAHLRAGNIPEARRIVLAADARDPGHPGVIALQQRLPE